MKSIIFLLSIAYLTISVVVIKSDSNQFITSFNPPRPTVKITYPFNININQVPNAVWVWAQDWNNPSAPSPITIAEDFYAVCPSKMTVYAAAGGNFTITINQNVVLSGFGRQRISNTTIKPKCGTNTFSIKAYNNGVGSLNNPAGLIYAIVQDTSSCYSCPNGQNWNPLTCSCEVNHILIQCENHCECRPNQIWIDFPSCACVCSGKKQCDQDYYYDKNICSCRCLPKPCTQGLTFDRDSCMCIPCIQDDCGGFIEYVWSKRTCKCERVSFKVV